TFSWQDSPAGPLSKWALPAAGRLSRPQRKGTSMSNLLRAFLRPFRAPCRPSTRSAFRRPMLEQLEDRTLLSNVQFTLYSIGPINSYAGVGFQENRVGFFRVSVNGRGDPNSNDFHPEINWGDGASSTGDLVYLGGDNQSSEYDIKGSHVYDQAGSN